MPDVMSGYRTPPDSSRGRPLLDPRTVPADVHAVAMDLTGNYPVNIRWSDGHATGIYTWRDLRERCRCAQCTRRAV